MTSPIPERTREAIDEYVKHGECGDFLEAVLRNDFVGAVCLADDDNLKALRTIAHYVWNHIDHMCWGSRQKVNAWRKARRAERLPRSEELCPEEASDAE